MICSKCGTENPSDAKFCIGCGVKIFDASMDVSPAFDVDYASFWERFLAYLIDSAVLTLGSVVVGFLGAFFVGFVMAIMGMEVEEMEDLFIVLYYILAFVLSWLYFTIMESSRMQATLGKKVLNLTVTDMSDKRITFGKATGRYWSKLISGAIFCVGYIMAAFTEKHQALHDMIAGTLVVKKKD
jgi:uncharacterized RDD family membrane protein YckC